MTSKELDAQAPALLAAMSLCGVDGARAARVLRQCLTRQSRDPEVSRAGLFREALRICGQGAAAPGKSHSGAGRIDFPGDSAFEALPWDIRTAVFLIAMLDFDLSETAFILQRDVRTLAERIEHALDQLKW